MVIDSIFLEITNRCGKHCDYCYNKLGFIDYNDIPYNVYNSLISKMQFLGIDKLTLSGGEPGMHPNFAEFVQLAHKYNIKLRINSNGFTLRKFESLIDQNTELQITVDGNKSMHDTYRGEGDYELLLNTIKGIRDNGFRGKITARYNMHGGCVEGTVDRIAEVCNDYEQMVDFFALSPVHYPNQKSQLTLLQYKEINKFKEELNFSKPSGMRVEIFVPPISCSIMRNNDNTVYSILIDYNGNVYPCQLCMYNSLFSLGNIICDDIVSIIKGEKIDNLKRTLQQETKCQMCSIKGICAGGCAALNCISPQIKGDGFCELRKYILGVKPKFRNYQCWS